MDGFYKVTFSTPIGLGYGVIFLADGKMHGGDSVMFYVGTYAVQGDTLTATMSAGQHSSAPSMKNVLGVSEATLSINVKRLGTALIGRATTPQAPGVNVSITLDKLLD